MTETPGNDPPLKKMHPMRVSFARAELGWHIEN